MARLGPADRAKLAAVKRQVGAARGPAAITQKDPLSSGGGFGAVPVLSQGMLFRDIGSTGLRAFSGWVREEFLPQLVGRTASTVYREMQDNSPTVGSILFAVQGVMRKVQWRVEPVDDSGAAQESADFVSSLMNDMDHSWDDFIVEALSMLPYGFSTHEIVYKRRNGRQNETADTPTSNYNDGKIGWHRLPIRSQDTILKWFFGLNGEILGYTQQPWVGTLTDIPMSKSLLFRPLQHKNNPEGRSILRNSYLPYTYIRRLQEQEAILFERMSGLPVVKIPQAIIDAAAAGDPQAQAFYTAAQNMVRNVRIDEQMGVVLPSDVWKSETGAGSVPMFHFELVTPASGRQNLDANTPIARYKLDILSSVLADFVQMGHEARGTQSLAVTKVDLFIQAIEGWLNCVGTVLNKYALPRIFRLNGMDEDLMPQLVPDLAQRIDLDVMSNVVLRLSQSGMPLFPDAELENYLRDAAGMPDLNDEGINTQRIMQELRQEIEDTKAQAKQDIASAKKPPTGGPAKKYDVLRAVILKTLASRAEHIGGSATTKKRRRRKVWQVGLG